MDTSAEGDLADAAAALRRRWRIAAACAVAGPLLASGALLAAPPTYTSVTAVHVRPTGVPEITGEQSGRTNGEVNLDTEAQIVRSAEVSAAAAERIGPGADPAELRREVEVGVPPNSSVLRISAPGPDPAAARRASAAFAGAYLDYRADQVDRQIGGTLSALRDEADSRYAELDRLTAEGGAEQARITALQSEITELNKEIHPLAALRESVVPAQVITSATTPEEATSPVPPVWLATGGALGLAAGVAAAFGAERRDRRLHTVRDARRAAGLPVLLHAPRTGGRARGGERARARARQEANRAALSLVADLGRSGGRSCGAVVLVPGIGGGAATAAAEELGAALARIGADVLLVRADPASAEWADRAEAAPVGAGLADVLLGGADPAELERRTAAAPGLRTLDYGSADATDVLQRPATARLLERLREQADVVVVATAPTAERADAYALTRCADAVVPVVELAADRADDLRSALDAFASLGAHVPGALAAEPRKKRQHRGRSGRAGERTRAVDGRAAGTGMPRAGYPASAPHGSPTGSPGGEDRHDGTDLTLQR
ncbi:chain length determinant family protein [Streptomonospora wellingtoniae]|uniref:Chain length determinant family protein n=1 Tax=Streptomonospora wellingtoniae TaxID=3075544 RepID=A0ABU2KSK1_9ACTN|nr:chain length determinant family protein [Streptomonospora sp. DSM 45055]MDT0302259.1 chain length determinant family protein [Streptomonospora sp. DSM 45055]